MAHVQAKLKNTYARSTSKPLEWGNSQAEPKLTNSFVYLKIVRPQFFSKQSLAYNLNLDRILNDKKQLASYQTKFGIFMNSLVH